MKKLLNTLFITTQGAYLFKEGETVVVSVEKKKKLQLPIHVLDGIVCFGQVSMSSYLMGFCAEKNVTVSFLTEYGKFLARVHGRTTGNVLLRREQYRKADDKSFCVKISKNFLIGKIANSRVVINRFLRDHGNKINAAEINSVSQRLKYTIEQLNRDYSLDELRGIEGDAAKYYFSVFDHLIVSQKEYFKFHERNRRPPLDFVNALLSFVYTLVMHDIRSALESVGLDSYVGFLHKDRPGRPSLGLDIMEEFRAFLADRLVLSLINREQISHKGFNISKSGSVLMDDETRKIVLAAYQKRKQEEISHPYLKEVVPVGILFFIQALLLARYLRGDLDGYPVFIWR